ncbi:MAG: hypothetical protein MUE81_14575 [Thermoflexibacter sp.]|nr:hypothetical protein [Thermoflexibacter sp.]
MLTKAQAKELINLIQENRIAYFFEKIDEYEVKTPQINQLRQEFVGGKYGYDYSERLQVYINSVIT